MKRCNWCGKHSSAIKHYCIDCKEHCFRECITCHKPYPSSRYFIAENSKRCRSCQNRWTKYSSCRAEAKTMGLIRMNPPPPPSPTTIGAAEKKLKKFHEEDEDEDYDYSSAEDYLLDDEDMEDEQQQPLVQKISKSKVQPIKQPKKRKQQQKAADAAVRSDMFDSIRNVLDAEQHTVKKRKLKHHTRTMSEPLSHEEKLRKQLYASIARLQCLAPEKCKVNISCQ